MSKNIDAAEGKWVANKYIISIIVFLISASCVLTWNIAKAYFDVKHKQETSLEKQKEMSSDVIDLKVSIKSAITDMTKVVDNNNSLISELIETLKDDKGRGDIKKTQPVVFKKLVYEDTNSSVN